ncbi:MAG: 16S rRNA methyltransferase [Spirochaetaceae bacterium]|jgi:16S rRNA (cytosine1407-C5)-methyltransferase|nr:16S rRNA methyltransferase [Spirochaetaceae bacterium]
MTAINPRFEAYYGNMSGSRWEGMRKSLLEKPEPVPFSEGLVRPYLLDYASITAARSLRLPEEGVILDACAAPGGKSLVLLSRLPPHLRLLANELSSERRRRLANVLADHLDAEKRGQVTVSGFDAAALGGRKSELCRFGGILLDVPCSSERHMLQKEKALSEWTAARPRFLARRQWTLLSAAFLLLAAGGSLVYATCALSIEENDGVASRLIEKYRNHAILDEPDFSEGEKTRFGRIILPDASGGVGPMYVARFRKII